MENFVVYNNKDLKALCYIIIKSKLKGKCTIKQLYNYLMGRTLITQTAEPKSTRTIAWLIRTHHNLKHFRGLWEVKDPQHPLDEYEAKIQEKLEKWEDLNES